MRWFPAGSFTWKWCLHMTPCKASRSKRFLFFPLNNGGHFEAAKKCLIIFCCPGFLHDFGMFSHLEPQIWESKNCVVSITAKLHRQCKYTFVYEGIIIWKDTHPKAWFDLLAVFLWASWFQLAGKHVHKICLTHFTLAKSFSRSVNQTPSSNLDSSRAQQPAINVQIHWMGFEIPGYYPYMSVYLPREKLWVSGKRRIWDRDLSCAPLLAYFDEIHEVHDLIQKNASSSVPNRSPLMTKKTPVNLPEVRSAVQKFPMLKQWYMIGINTKPLPKNKSMMILTKHFQMPPQIWLSKKLLGFLCV